MYVSFFVLFVLLVYVSYKTVCVLRKQWRTQKIMTKNFLGPELKFFVGSGLDFVGNKGILQVFKEYQMKFGDVVYVRIGPIGNALIISDFNFLRSILRGNNQDKGLIYSFTENWLGNGILTAPAEESLSRKKIVGGAFEFHVLVDYIEVFDEQCEILTEKLSDISTSDSIDIHSFISLCSLDIICETSMGVKIGAQRNHNMEYVSAVKEMCRVIADRSHSVLKSMKPFYVFSEDYRTEKKCVKTLHHYVDNVIEKKRIERQLKEPVQKPLEKEKQVKQKNIFEKKESLLEIMFNSYETDNTPLTQKDIKDEVNTFMFAGHDTVTAAVSFFIYEIAKHVDVQDELYDEQQSIYGTRVDKTVKYTDLPEMKLLDLAMKESLRLYPPVPIFMRKVTEEFEYEGKLIPEGVNLAQFIYGLQRNVKYYDEPDTFRFRRFEEPGLKPFIPFSMGPRSCIGQRFALWEMKVMLSQLIRKFEFRPAEPEHVLDLRAEVVLTSKNGINVKVIKRQK